MKHLEYYGIYTTYNIYDSHWYAFSRDDANAYWSGDPCVKGKGKSPKEALNNYNEEQQSNVPIKD